LRSSKINSPAVLDGHTEGYFQVVAVERIDVDIQPNAARACSRRRLCIRRRWRSCGEAEAAVGEEPRRWLIAGAPTRRHRQHPGHVEMRRADVAAQDVFQGDAVGQADVGVCMPVRDAQRNELVERS